MEVAPKKAKDRREAAAKDARVERWAEDSGNAALMGRELPPAEVLAADQRITAWARELKKAGLEGDMDVLRARAFLDLLLGKDSRPRQDADGGEDPTRPGGPGPGGPGPGGPAHGAAGFAGRVTLTVPLATVTGRADRPGELGGIGPADPWLARDLAARGRAQPGHDVVRDRHRPARPRHRPRLRPPRTQKAQATRRPRPARRNRVQVHACQPGRPARRVRHLMAAAHPRTRPGPAHHPGVPDH